MSSCDLNFYKTGENNYFNEKFKNNSWKYFKYQ